MNYQLYEGDCLDIMPTLAAQSVDAVICDPPYGTTACAWDSVIPFAPMWECIKRVIKPRGAVVLFGSQPFTSALVMSNPQWFKYCWVWEKTNSSDFMLAQYRPRQNYEDIIVFSKGTHIYNPQMEYGKPYVDKPRNRSNNIANSTMPKLGIVNQGTRYPSAIQTFSNGNNDILHPTQKPLTLMNYLVKTYTNPGETVLDFTFGSCSTGVACLETGRNFIGIEKDANYFAIAQDRIEKAYRRAAGQARQGKASDFANLPMFAEVAA